MAVLTEDQLAKLRRELASARDPAEPIDYTKAEANAMFQSMEDSLSTGGGALNAINESVASGGAGGVFSAGDRALALKVMQRAKGV